MSKPENRSQLMKYFGAKQKNSVWAWCGVNDEEKAVYFSVWTDLRNMHGDRDRNYYTIQEPHWGANPETGTVSPARKDHDDNLTKVFEQGYESYGYFIDAKSKTAVPREIETTRTSFIFLLELERLENGVVIGYPLRRIEVR